MMQWCKITDRVDSLGDTVENVEKDGDIHADQKVDVVHADLVQQRVVRGA